MGNCNCTLDTINISNSITVSIDNTNKIINDGLYTSNCVSKFSKKTSTIDSDSKFKIIKQDHIKNQVVQLDNISKKGKENIDPNLK